MKRGTNDVFLQRHFLITTTGRTDSPRDARSVELANFQWKLVQRCEVFLKVARNLEENSSFPRYFQTFRPFLSLFPIYLVPLHSVKFESKI